MFLFRAERAEAVRIVAAVGAQKAAMMAAFLAAAQRLSWYSSEKRSLPCSVDGGFELIPTQCQYGVGVSMWCPHSINSVSMCSKICQHGVNMVSMW